MSDPSRLRQVVPAVLPSAERTPRLFARVPHWILAAAFVLPVVLVEAFACEYRDDLLILDILLLVGLLAPGLMKRFTRKKLFGILFSLCLWALFTFAIADTHGDVPLAGVPWFWLLATGVPVSLIALGEIPKHVRSKKVRGPDLLMMPLAALVASCLTLMMTEGSVMMGLSRRVGDPFVVRRLQVIPFSAGPARAVLTWVFVPWVAGMLADWPSPSSRRRVWRLMFLALCVVAGFAAFAHFLWVPFHGVRPAAERTVLTEPLNECGGIDYCAALNREYGAGLAPKENAFPLLMRGCIAADATPEPSFQKVLETAGIRELERPAERFIPLRVYGLAWLVECTDGIVPLDDPLFQRHPELLPLLRAIVSGDSFEITPKLGRRLVDMGRLEGVDGVTVGDVMTEVQAPIQKYSQKDVAAWEQPWTAKQYSWLADWLNRNAAPLDRLRAASLCRRYYLPSCSIETPASLLAAHTSASHFFREPTQALAARGMNRISKGDLDGTWQDAMTLLRLSRLQGLSIDISELFWGSLSEDLGLAIVDEILHHPSLTAAAARRLLGEIRTLRPPDTYLRHYDLRGTFWELDRVQRGMWTNPGKIVASVARLPGACGYDVNELLRATVAWRDLQLDALRKADFRLPAAPDSLEQRRLELQDWFDTSERYEGCHMAVALTRFCARGPREIHHQLTEAIGRQSLRTHDSSAFLRSEQRRALRMTEAIIAVALAAYRLERGGFPDTVDVLFPSYLPGKLSDLACHPLLRYERREQPAGYVLTVEHESIDEEAQSFFTFRYPAATRPVPATAPASTQPAP